ncbi:PLP-binding barrel [Glarea lozoyensis ATCC 20868]|uniref:Pyridoxal phosphate homeostasis protein n=1 Tax=Glarea lozoyensis (strain ATCC 20868 / MF5171) TaxID=1116229 RepID=S3D7R6_GLAL2|nr:PLP-binding barrel [Glarea lozoyensis ATCC 20868]EPE33164.1 PLP-binding barrel [Glarea lozoyensis ATCC 20868]
MSDEMKVDPTRAKDLVGALQSVSQRIAKSAGGRNVRLVAVSKLKPATDILALYQDQDVKQVHFGENYAQELTEKAKMLPKEIKWHFIGGLQSNKCKPLASQIPNLFCVSSIDSSKKATQLNLGRESHPDLPPLNVHIQLNTSGEESKSGVSPGTPATELCQYILDNCPSLNLLGLMTIGAIARSKEMKEGEENEDFKVLKDERDRLEKELKGLKGKLELSMGMSEDFEGAIEMGSDEVRVGSTIFGVRPKKEDFKVKGEVEEEKS